MTEGDGVVTAVLVTAAGSEEDGDEDGRMTKVLSGAAVVDRAVSIVEDETKIPVALAEIELVNESGSALDGTVDDDTGDELTCKVVEDPAMS